MHNGLENNRAFSRAAETTDMRKRSRILDVEVGQSIRYYRKRAKMTLMELANRLCIAYQQVQKYEKGVNRVGAGRLMEIAEVLNTPVASFFEAKLDQSGAVAAASSASRSADSELTYQGRV